MDTTFCPNCRGNIPQQAWVMHELTCSRRNYYCESCETVIQKSEQEKHDRDLHTTVYCGCGEDIEAQFLKQHQRDECTKRLVICQYCKCHVTAGELEEHMYPCGSRTDVCEDCDKRIQLRHFADHVCELSNSPPSEQPEPEPQPVPELPVLNPDELIMCPFCMAPERDYMLLQEHIFTNHSDSITE